MTDRELMQQALEALENVAAHYGDYWEDIITALRERLAQPEQWEQLYPGMGNPFQPQRTHWEGCEEVHPECRKPEQKAVAHLWQHTETGRTRIVMPDQIITADATWHVVGPLYLTPPRREWVGLTEEEVDECYYWKGRQWTTDELVRHVEAKLKEKNA